MCRDPDDEHLEPARAVHALDAAELDVRGRGGAGDEGERAPLAGGRREALDSLGHRADDLIDLHHAEMEIRHERQRAAALAGAAVEHDRARLGDRRAAAGEHAVDGVERLVRQTVIGHELDVRRAPGLRQVGRDHEPARPVAPARLPQRRRERVRLDNEHDGLVVGHALGQQVAQAIGVEPEGAFVFALDGHVVGQLVGRDVGQRGPDPPEDVVARGHAGPSRRRVRHHSRNVCAGRLFRSRARVQADRGGGSRSMRSPPRASGHWPRRARRCPRS